MIKSNRLIVAWLFTGCLLIFSMVIVGGLTRLTHSGLSMVEWNLFMGSIPPTSEADWQELFEKYTHYPEYQLVNFNFSIEEFKSIFYWEYGHRMLGRFIGLVFIVPFLIFWAKKKISRSLMPKLLLILFMGGFQGFLGYYMVESGLVKNPDVSHYRLAMHLTTAFITFAYTFWVSLGLIYPHHNNSKMLKHPMRKLFVVTLIGLVIQVIWGAYVAGLNAGKVYTTWPKMGEDWIAAAVTAMEPIWLNFVEGIAGVQFVHRYIAYVIVLLVIWIAIKARRYTQSPQQKLAVRLISGMVGIQFILGVGTLMMGVPVYMGLIHQIGAFVLLAIMVFGLHSYQRMQES